MATGPTPPDAGELAELVQRFGEQLSALQATYERLARAVAVAAPAEESAPRAETPAPAAGGGTQLSASAGPFTVVFDGGSLGNPGHGYGSYRITGRAGLIGHEQLDYARVGDRITNNQAEYMTLIAALAKLVERLGNEAQAATVNVLGDSQLVINQVNGRWKVRNPELMPLHEVASDLLRRFGRATLTWQPRERSVRVLGH